VRYFARRIQHPTAVVTVTDQSMVEWRPEYPVHRSRHVAVALAGSSNSILPIQACEPPRTIARRECSRPAGLPRSQRPDSALRGTRSGELTPARRVHPGASPERPPTAQSAHPRPRQPRVDGRGKAGSFRPELTRHAHCARRERDLSHPASPLLCPLCRSLTGAFRLSGTGRSAERRSGAHPRVVGWT
jgi:hypothetical protein